MGRGASRNQPCPCGSGHKFKRCCLHLPAPKRVPSVYEKLARGQLPVRAEITAEPDAVASDAPAQMQIYEARVVTNGQERTIFNDKIELAVNSQPSDLEAQESAAAISIPLSADEPAMIQTSGNAAVFNESGYPEIGIRDDVKRLKAKSESGMFAVARIRTQRDSGYQFFDLLFGKSGERETLDRTGKKNRPHVAFFPDGNGKFVRVGDYACQLRGALDYDRGTKSIRPSEVRLELDEIKETLVLLFNQTPNTHRVELSSIQFHRDEPGASDATA